MGGTMFGGKNGFFYRTDLDIFGVTGEGGRGGDEISPCTANNIKLWNSSFCKRKGVNGFWKFEVGFWEILGRRSDWEEVVTFWSSGFRVFRAGKANTKQKSRKLWNISVPTNKYLNSPFTYLSFNIFEKEFSISVIWNKDTEDSFFALDVN